MLFAVDPATATINPKVRNNIPGLEALNHADLLVGEALGQELEGVPGGQAKGFRHGQKE